MSPERLALVRILGYAVAAVVLGLGVALGGTPGTILLVLGLLAVAALFATFRLR